MRDKELIKGHYYTIINSDKKCYFKFNYLDRHVYLEWYLGVDVKYTNNAPFLLGDNYIFKEVCLSEFVVYLPKEHPDRITFRKQRIKTLLDENR